MRLAAAIAVLLLAGCSGGSETGAPAPPGGPRFTEIELGVTHEAGVPGSYHMPQIMGAGVALLDHDGDGDLDLYLVNGAREGAALANRLLRREADGTYRDVTAASGLGDPGYGMGAAVGDYDNDGDPDVYVTNYGPDALYRNEGDGTFTNVTRAAGAVNDGWACSAAFLDYDRDGRLDLYVANYVRYAAPKVCSDDAGRPEYCGPLASPPTDDVLLHNEGDGTFTDVSAPAGIAGTPGRGLGVLCEDFDGDGWLDVYVANDGEPNFLWLNGGDGTFTESAAMLGVALNAFANTEASMGVTAGDVDGDGDLDLFMTHLVRESNTFYRNDGTGAFDDVTASVGLASPSFALTGFGTAFFDFDNDGALDLAAVNGRVKRGDVLPGAAGPLAAYAEPNLLFRNDGTGVFVDVAGGALCDRVEVSRGLAAGDLDDDGDVDLVVTNCGGPARVYRNDTPGAGHWLMVRAVDPALGRDAHGAWITVRAGGRVVHRTVSPAASYASSGDPRAHFGLGVATRVEDVSVRWPDGSVESFGPMDVDRQVTLRKGRGAGG